jgi:4-aminobutyrate aminotransferase/(S)-3-amino-2-methylpropionate transaminase
MTAKAMPFKRGFGPFAPEIYRVPASYPYRDGLTGTEAAATMISHIERTIGAATVAAVVAEPIQGEGGFIVPAPGFLTAIAEFCRAAGILFVADEIQAGFCRTGAWFASEHDSLVPDLVTTAKGIAGGLPLAAVTGRADVMDAVHAGGLGGTYGGSPVACAAALGAIEWMQVTDAPATARAIGDVLLTRLRELQARFPQIGDIRGRGAMIAMELVEPGGLTPDPALAAAISRYCHANGVVTLVTGSYGNVIRFLPPLTIPEHLLHDAFEVIGDAFAASAEEA